MRSSIILKSVRHDSHKMAKIAYRIFLCKIFCHHYTMSKVGDNDKHREFYMRKYDKRLLPFTTFDWCLRYTSVKTTVFYIIV